MESSSELFSKEQWLVKALSKAKPAAAEKKLLTRRRKLAERHSFLGANHQEEPLMRPNNRVDVEK
jgi:hypothetical protein